MAVILAALVAAVLLGASTAGWFRYRTRRLRASFGPELKTVALEYDGMREADRELRRRVSLHKSLRLRAIDARDREFHTASWGHLQAEFVDSPSLALAAAGRLVSTVLDARGYPDGDEEGQLALLSVRYATCLAGYRAAQQTRRRATQGAAAVPTEALRLAMLSYRALFTELLGDPGAAAPVQRGEAWMKRNNMEVKL